MSDRIAIVTGANTGLGFEVVRALAAQGLNTVMACRNMERGERARARIAAESPSAQLEVMELDLSSLDSVRRFAEAFLKARKGRLDLLINNAGVMATPPSKTADGFELQFGTNHLGHFLLTGLLLDAVTGTDGSRVVTVSSIAHKRGVLDFDDLQSEKDYDAWVAYRQSKLANLMFTFELQRRLEKAGHKTLSLGAHPGVARTELARHMPTWLVLSMNFTIGLVLTHSAASGARPLLMAALDEGVKGGEYFGPQSFREWRGGPGRAQIAEHATDQQVAGRLWDVSQELTGINYL